MEYEYGRGGQGGGYETARPPLYQGRPDRGGGNVHGNNSSFYPRIAQPSGGPPMNRPPPPPPPVSNPSLSSSGTGIKVAIKPTYRLAPPAQLLIQSREVPRSLFQFEFDLERRILAEAELQGNPHVRDSATPELSQANGGGGNLAAVEEDATVSKYVAMGLNKQAVMIALQTFGDVQNKVLKFCPSYTRIREMGFPPDEVAGALAMFDNDEERAIAYLV